MPVDSAQCRHTVRLMLLLLAVAPCLSFPTGAPLSACSHLMPVHIDGELQTVVSPYVLVLNETTYGSSPIRCNMGRYPPPPFFLS